MSKPYALIVWIRENIVRLLHQNPEDERAPDDAMGIIRSNGAGVNNSKRTVQVTAVLDSENSIQVSDSENYITVMLTTDCMNKLR